MSACSCGIDVDVLGSCIRGPHVARTIPKGRRGNTCPNCECPVEIGDLCIDQAGLYADDYSGFFGRFHPECWELMVRFANYVCGGGWYWPFDLDEAAEHAMAHGDEPHWRDWLLLYERTWAWRPFVERNDPPRVAGADQERRTLVYSIHKGRFLDEGEVER